MNNTVLLEKSTRGVATVTLNRPDKHNAFDDVIIAQLIQAFKDVDQDPDVRVMVLAANGKNFSAGGDLDWMKRMATYSHDENLADAKNLALMLRTLNELSKPTIARVHGAAFGGAVGLLSCCDMAVANSSARFCLSEVKIGLAPATIGPYVIAAIGARAARRYFLSAEVFNAEQALALGLLSVVSEDQQLDDSLNAVINAVLANSPQALSAAKRLIFDLENRPISDAVMNETSEVIATLRASEEGQEGLSAFLQKRSPSWKV